jgi:uncharacterized protein YqeY
MLEELIREQIKIAMKQRDELTKDILRLVVGEFQQAAANKDIVESDKLAILKRVIKGIESSLDQIAGLDSRDDLRQKLEAEGTILRKFLPQTMTINEMRRFIVANNVDLTTIGKAIGQTIKLLKQNELNYDNEAVRLAILTLEKK